VTTRIDKSICSWYDGPCLFETLDELPLPVRFNDKGIRLPIIDKMKDQGGIFAFGKLEAGIIKEGMMVMM